MPSHLPCCPDPHTWTTLTSLRVWTRFFSSFLITSSLRETCIGVMDKRIELANLCNFSRSSQQLEPEEDEGISSLILKGGFNWSQRMSPMNLWCWICVGPLSPPVTKGNLLSLKTIITSSEIKALFL